MKMFPPFRSWLVVMLAFGALTSLNPSRLSAAENPPQKPDVLLVICDQWNPKYVSWDEPQVRTPVLDAIAHEGMIFNRCYSNSPLCMPARISLVTGWYPHNHNVWGNTNTYHLSPTIAPMFRDIKQAGLLTAQIGKLHWFSGADWNNEFRSLEEYHRAMGLDVVTSVAGPPDSDAGRDPYCQYLSKRGLLTAVARDQLFRLREWAYEARPSVVGPEDYHDTFVTGVATDFIREQPHDQPLCLVVSLHSPHPPLDAPGEFATMFDPEKLVLPANVPEHFNYDGRDVTQPELRKLLANYLGKMALCDQCIGRLVEAMKARGTWDNSLFIFTSDHGEMMGAHGGLSKGRFWEESARIPLVMRWPGHVRVGRSEALVQLFDVYPTIVGAAGGNVSPGRFARSLLPVATGREVNCRDLVVSEIGKRPPLSMMARDKRYKWWSDENEERLFDLTTDPLEQHDLHASPEHAAILQDMRNKTLTFLRSTQVDVAEGSKSKVKRVREAAEKENKTDQKKDP